MAGALLVRLGGRAPRDLQRRPPHPVALAGAGLPRDQGDRRRRLPHRRRRRRAGTAAGGAALHDRRRRDRAGLHDPHDRAPGLGPGPSRAVLEDPDAAADGDPGWCAGPGLMGFGLAAGASYRRGTSSECPASLAWLAWPGVVLAALAAVYTAFLFAQAGGRDLWQSPLLAWHLLVQAVMAGRAALLLAGVRQIAVPPCEAAARSWPGRLGGRPRRSTCC